MPKSDKTAANATAEDPLNAAQVLFSMDPDCAPQAKLFWQTREQFFKDAGKFCDAWFERWQEATRSTLDLASTIARDGLQDPARAMRATADWQARSMERLAEDAKVYAELMTGCIGTFVPKKIAAVGKKAKKSKGSPKEKRAKETRRTRRETNHL